MDHQGDRSPGRTNIQRRSPRWEHSGHVGGAARRSVRLLTEQVGWKGSDDQGGSDGVRSCQGMEVTVRTVAFALWR